jgi:hypothetical protein
MDEGYKSNPDYKQAKAEYEAARDEYMATRELATRLIRTLGDPLFWDVVRANRTLMRIELLRLKNTYVPPDTWRRNREAGVRMAVAFKRAVAIAESAR